MILRAATLRGVMALVACALLTACAVGTDPASAQSTWRLEQPQPPEAPPAARGAPAPVGLGKIGDIAFWAPNRGVLITAGNPPTIPAGVWAYNGAGWHELSTVCGATDGRIAWAGPNEFWTISDGRPGQAEVDDKVPPLTDDTLCRFAEGEVVESFAAPAFEASSYMPMHAAACIGADDCWFGGDPLPEQSTEIGAFQLHWNGAAMSAVPYRGEGHAIEDMQGLEGRLYESVRLRHPCVTQSEAACDAVVKNAAVPPALHVLNPELPGGFDPEESLGRSILYAEGQLPWSLDFLHLSAGVGGLWAAAGERPESNEAAQVTVLRYTPEAGGEWTQLLGPATLPSGQSRFPEQTVEAIATEPGPGEESAWLALQSVHEALLSERGAPRSSSDATVARISAGGTLLQQESLPSPSEVGVGPRGAAYKLSCPAVGDCWLATTEGWLFHLAPEGERTLPEDTDPSFAGVITERPPDQGLPQTQPDSVPPDDSGLAGEQNTLPPVPAVTKAQEEVRVPVALVSAIHTRLIHGTTLELRFHLAVKARIRLLAKRKRRIVASSPTYTFSAGSRRVLLRLNRKRWPTELHLVEHPLAPLPTVSARAGGSETVETDSLAFPSHLRSGVLGNALGLR